MSQYITLRHSNKSKLSEVDVYKKIKINRLKAIRTKHVNVQKENSFVTKIKVKLSFEK